MTDVLEQRTEVGTADGPIAISQAVPDGARHGLVVIQEVFGVNDHIRDITRRFAAEGFHAVAPHLFHRTGDPEFGYSDFGAVGPHMAVLTDDAVLSDIDAAIGVLHDAGYADHQIGIVGFCFGGRAAFLAAIERDLGAAVTFYGGGIVTASPYFPIPSLLERANEVSVPWLGMFGDLDQSIPITDVEQLRNALTATKTETDIVRFDLGGHGFHCDARDSYHQPSAVDAWGRAVAWLDDHLE